MTLLETLTQNTQDLKKEYLEQTEKWASEEFDRLIQVLKWNEARWCKYFNLTPRKANEGTSMEFLAMPSNFYNTKDARKMDSMKTQAARMKRMGKDEFIKKQKMLAELHYQDSLLKLVDRLAKKGVSDKNVKGDLSIKKARIGINIELFISIGDITAKAWTIVASGPIQRPHYRYLVK